MNELTEIGINTLYLIALINPISKVSILLSFSVDHRDKEFLSLAAKSTIAAIVILLGAMTAGNFLLQSVFRVDLYSLRVAGGVVVFWMGLNALRRGVFFENDQHTQVQEIALVPLACPMIAGPGTIAGCIALRAQDGLFTATIAMLLAVIANHIVMLLSQSIGRLLSRFNFLGALIRITGLIVMTIGTQMALDGIASWLAGRQL